MIKTFRGLIQDDAQDTIILHTNDGSMGYRIVNFQVIDGEPGVIDAESVVKIYKVSQSTNTGTVDFSDQTLLGVAFYSIDDVTPNQKSSTIIFDKEVFNQDIYITHINNKGAGNVNYYIELEQVKLDLSSNTVATLKDIRNEFTSVTGTP